MTDAAALRAATNTTDSSVQWRPSLAWAAVLRMLVSYRLITSSPMLMPRSAASAPISCAQYIVVREQASGD
jgi:hypothetical protein